MPAKDRDIYTLKVRGSGRTLEVECAVSESVRALGLSGRPSLPAGRGMFFIFPTVSRQTMWMPDMNFPLDIVWLNENMEVIHINYGAQPCETRDRCPLLSSEGYVKYAIELAAGQAEGLGIRVGAQLAVL
jgi:uncharacterized membrane protein (UPF0127 family)